jgi:riboflavin kinase/FMN adenylyltransferase
MRIFRDLEHRELSRSSVVTIGNFDGLHRGHQALLERCRAAAGQGGEIAVVTFEPSPWTWFNPERPTTRLVGVGHKLELLRAAGVDLVWMMRFNGRLATTPARDFVSGMLVSGLGARQVVIGEDFRFGKGREGDVDMLRMLGRTAGFTVDAVPSVKEAGVRISSTAIREVLAGADLDSVETMLGRRYTMLGRVIRGRQLGRELGYATANVRPPGSNCALAGVFAVRSRVPGGPWRDGVANLGSRPVVGGGEPLLEVHLFDYEGDLYGQKLETCFVRRIREESNFASLEALVEQMQDDEQQARSMLDMTRSETTED